MDVVNRGDTYPGEVANTVNRVMERLNFSHSYRLVWQSQVGPKAWLGPQTSDAIEGYARIKKNNLLLVPIAFTQDHIETLFELDFEYCHHLAKKVKKRKEERCFEKFSLFIFLKAGIQNIRRCESLNDNPIFLRALADIVKEHIDSNTNCTTQLPLRCPMCVNEACGPMKYFFKSNKVV